MSIVVYWLSKGRPFAEFFTDDQLLAALAFSETRRKEKDEAGKPLNNHIVTNSELGDCVSKPGVSDELPEDYSWSKAHRGGPPGPEGQAKTLA
jgi:hypothetical protein